jgi:hypothetical protein
VNELLADLVDECRPRVAPGFDDARAHLRDHLRGRLQPQRLFLVDAERNALLLPGDGLTWVRER